jgi:hypothetical protein
MDENAPSLVTLLADKLLSFSPGRLPHFVAEHVFSSEPRPNARKCLLVPNFLFDGMGECKKVLLTLI